MTKAIRLEPFDSNEDRLRSLVDLLLLMVMCDKTEEIGWKLQKQVDNIGVLKASIKRSEQVKSLEHLYLEVQVDKQKVHINPTLLFSRLIAIVQRE